MKTRHAIVSVLLVSGTMLVAQQPAFKRTVLQQADLSVAGREAVTAKAELPTGVSAGRHTHPGEEIGYVLEGTVSLEIEGVSKPLKAGDAFLIPAREGSQRHEHRRRPGHDSRDLYRREGQAARDASEVAAMNARGRAAVVRSCSP